ncbi:MAG TPA: acyl-CoA desaturase [Polyangiaceae bacterium]|nr:acyl-CoA desaturase [Polyangiaceae bacterium]
MQLVTLEMMTENTQASYVRELRPRLKRGAFRPARSRLWWLPAHLAVITLCISALRQHWLPWLLAPLLSLVIGLSFAGLTFLGHETLHGAIVRSPRLRYLVGWLGFAPFVVSPRLWLAWHNRVHHGSTQREGKDPDAYPTLREYRHSRAIRLATRIAPGLGRLRGASTPLLGFSVQSLHMLFAARTRGFLSNRERAYASAETLLGVALWTSLAFALGGLLFLFAFVLPLLVANAVVMSFILTNHSLSPLTELNDPLRNTLSVTTPRVVEWLTLGFGYHVEHHLFPTMSARHAPEVRALLLAHYPERYQSMPLCRATAALHRSARVYKDATTLIDPSSGREWPALRATEPARATGIESSAPPAQPTPPPLYPPAPPSAGHVARGAPPPSKAC